MKHNGTIFVHVDVTYCACFILDIDWEKIIYAVKLKTPFHQHLQFWRPFNFFNWHKPATLAHYSFLYFMHCICSMLHIELKLGWDYLKQIFKICENIEDNVPQKFSTTIEMLCLVLKWNSTDNHQKYRQKLNLQPFPCTFFVEFAASKTTALVFSSVVLYLHL